MHSFHMDAPSSLCLAAQSSMSRCSCSLQPASKSASHVAASKNLFPATRGASLTHWPPRQNPLPAWEEYRSHTQQSYRGPSGLCPALQLSASRGFQSLQPASTSASQGATGKTPLLAQEGYCSHELQSYGGAGRLHAARSHVDRANPVA